MKRPLILSSLILALAFGCEKTPGEGSDGCPIGFGVTGTKAEINMPAGTFSVIGRRCIGSSWDSSEALDVFATSIQNVTTDGTGACSYTPTQYWKINSVYRFRAVSPIAPDLVSYSDDLSGDAVISNFSVNSSAASQMDLMMSNLAASIVGQVIGSPAPVALTFRHLLANIHIQIVEDTTKPLGAVGTDEFTINGVRLTGMPDKGTYTGTGTAGTWDTSYASSLSCVNNTSHIAPDTFTETDGGGVLKCEVWPEGLKLIPQTVNTSNAVTLVVNYLVSHNGGPASSKSVSIPIPDITWLPGMKYTYQLAMSEEPSILLGGISVETWGSTQANGSIIIK